MSSGEGGWKRHLDSTVPPSPPTSSCCSPSPPPRPSTPGRGCVQCTVCSAEIRLLRQRNGLAIGPFLLHSLPWWGPGVGQGTQGGPHRGSHRKEGGWEGIQQAASVNTPPLHLSPPLMWPTEASLRATVPRHGGPGGEHATRCTGVHVELCSRKEPSRRERLLRRFSLWFASYADEE